MHLKILELITLSENSIIAKLCDDPNATTDSLAQLQHIFGHIEKEWERIDGRIEAKEKLKEQRAFQAMMRKSGKTSIKQEEMKENGPKKAVKKTLRGCSWSQALMILSFWVTKKPQLIPKVVFGLDLEEEHGRMWHMMHAYQKEPQATPSTGESRHDFTAGGEGTFDDTVDSDASMVIRMSKGPQGDAPPPGFLDTRFSEYKLGNFKTRFYSEPEFPKTLDANFSEESLLKKAKEAAAARNAAIWAAKIEEEERKSGEEGRDQDYLA